MPAKYQILRMETLGTPPVLQRGKLMVFNDPAEAAANAKYLAKQLGEKLCVKPIVNDEWRDREEARYAKGTYRVLPWVGSDWWNSPGAYAIWKDHFPHAALEKPGWIAFTKDEADGSKDKQTLLRPGAYLTRYFEKTLRDYGYSSAALSEQFMKMYGPIEVKFATTKEEVIKVYDGLATCMAGKRWPKNTHPATIYLAGDLQIAYIGNLEAGRVSARTLVWPDRKIHSRVYGDIARLTQGLERLGYKWGAPIGAKLQRVKLNSVEFDGGGVPSGCFLVPYIDKKNQQGGGHLGVKDDGEHLIICADGESGSHHAGQADGVSGPYVPRDDEYPTFTCDRCDEGGFRRVYEVLDREPDDEDVHEPIMWCEECREHATQCGYSGNWYTDDMAMVDVAGHPWLEYYADMYAARCDGNGNLYAKDDLVKVHFADGKTKKLSHYYIQMNTSGVFKSSLTNYFYLKDERAIVHNSWGEQSYCATSELRTRAFKCDDCGTHWLLELRNQHDDKLLCPNCNHKLEKKNKKPSSATRQVYVSTLTGATSASQYQNLKVR